MLQHWRNPPRIACSGIGGQTSACLHGLKPYPTFDLTLGGALKFLFLQGPERSRHPEAG